MNIFKNKFRLLYAVIVMMIYIFYTVIKENANLNGRALFFNNGNWLHATTSPANSKIIGAE